MPVENELQKTIKIVFLLLFPYFLCIIVYYVILPKSAIEDNNTLQGLAVLRVTIVLMLVSYVLSCCYAFQIAWKYCVLIATGLVLASVSDALSMYEGKIDNGYVYVLGFSGLSHLLYAIAFGFTPVKPEIGVLTALPFVGLLMVFIPRVQYILMYILIFYIVINALLLWRIIITISQHQGQLSIAIMATTLGGVCLAIADSVAEYNRIHSAIRYANVIIPLTYYIGQLGIASSIFNLPHELRPRDPNLHVSSDECYEQICHGCPFP